MPRFRHSLTLLVLGCAHAPAAAPAAPAAAPVKLAGLGDYHRAITTASPEAQQWFDQGLQLLYGFNHDEAQRSFEQASRIDPTCAMCAWGAALVLGPNYNLPAMADRAKAAFEALRQAEARSGGTEVERALIAALAHRYSSPPPADDKAQAALDQGYADAMRAVASRFPDDDDVQVLFAESLMDLRPWKLWTEDGQPAPGTEEIVAALERVLARHPMHPGANHYYIHVVEASAHPERGLAAAERLKTLVPGAGHLVHMSAHIYQRTGRYEDAAEANRRAIAADQKYLAAAHPEGFYGMYVAHNYQFLSSSAMMAGRCDEALGAARTMVASVPPDTYKQMPGMDFILPLPALVLARCGRWEEVLKETRPPADLPFATGLDHYARARALAALDRLDEAEREASALDDSARTLPKGLTADMAPGPLFLEVAQDLARGDLALRRGRSDEGLARLEAAVKAGDALPYSEPADWFYPPRQTLGARLLAAHHPERAEAVYREDLRRNPQNGWSLTGLRSALRAQKKPTADVDAQLARAFATADRRIDVSDY